MCNRGPEVLNAIKKSAALPTMPAVALEIVRLTRDPAVRIEAVAEAKSQMLRLALAEADRRACGATRPA